MQKENIDLIIIKISSNSKVAVNLKIYKDGRIYRCGNGSLPELKVGCMSFTKETSCFQSLMNDVPQKALNRPFNYQEETPNGILEYFIGFYNESEDKTKKLPKATGLRFVMDQRTRYNHPALGLIDGLAIKAIEQTNPWYFDVYMHTVFNAKSSTFPQENIITTPETEEEVLSDYKNYIKQIKQNSRGWKFDEFIKNKTYTVNGKTTIAILESHDKRFNIGFQPFIVN